ncbi:MAG TPA: helix-turn-helix domain-containing GNAT family N-acetyltransferase [Burkholderiaceae bacterium]|nr:helix-turn-helix domain-containing GNAT family N-acetyltransferase [Burkholderiaceae bacterium]
MIRPVRHDPIEQVRHFNRAYSAAVSGLGRASPGSAWSPGQERTLAEIVNRAGCTASEICEALAMDAAQASRLIASLTSAGLVSRTREPGDRRAWQLSATPAGRKVFNEQDRAARRAVARRLQALSPAQQTDLLAAMGRISALLGLEHVASAKSDSHCAVALREPQAGDIGWIVHRQAVLYAQEYGWDNRFEALIARIGAQFIENFDPRREACWVAQRGSEIVGSVFLVRRSATVGQLRLLYVEPAARGQGAGDRLVQACIDRAVEVGYRRLMLWTNDVLSAARRIYERKGFVKVSEEPHGSFGHDLVGQNWVLTLSRRVSG